MDETSMSDLPNRMPYTNPSAISNSANKYFTNPTSKISKLNLNILNNANAMNNYLSVKSSKQTNTNTNTNANTNSDGDLINILQQQKNNSKLNKISKSKSNQPTPLSFQL